MGRPINKKYFGNTNYPYDNEQTGGPSGTGGEGVATFAINTTGTLYTTSTTLTGTFSAPQIAGGIRATGNVTTDANGNTISATLVNQGSGYTSTPSFTLTASTTGTSATFTITLTTSRPNALAFTSYLSTGSSAVAGGDVLKQEASRRYLVRNSQGQGQVKLVTSDTLAAGQMNLVATDSAGATFWVKKLTARKAVLVGRTGTGTEAITMVTDYDGIRTGVAHWTLGSATGTVVTIANV